MKKILFLCIVLLLLVAIIWAAIDVRKMDSSSMKPAMNPGDFVICTPWFSKTHLKSGDLVIVNLKTPDGQAMTIRRFSDYRDGGVTAWLTADAPNGIDSKQVGNIPISDISSKVLTVIP